MTRDEAIYHLTWVKDLSEMIGMVPIGTESRKAIDTAISALRDPQPDPETGLVRCGCGIALTLDHNITMNEYRVVCYGCGWRTTFRVDKEKVIKIANIAMGYREAGE